MKDPVCGMNVGAAHVHPAAPAAPVPSGHAPADRREYTCPMHPEIVRDEPGPCPICGMALEPRGVTLDEQNPELDDMERRFRWSLVVTAPILALMVSELRLPPRAR